MGELAKRLMDLELPEEPREGTLAESLWKVRISIEGADESEVLDISGWEWEEEIESRTSQFYNCSGNEFAKAVSVGQNSYAQNSYVRGVYELIREKYSSLGRRIWAPRTDDWLDRCITNRLNSLNNVGIGYVNPEEFTTKERRKVVREYDGIFLGVPGLIDLGITNLVNEGNIGLGTGIISGGVITASSYLLSRYILNNHMKRGLEYLENVASKTDGVLRLFPYRENA